MESRIKKLFDIQKFQKNSSLEKVIAELERKYSDTLSDDELERVSAAGELKMEPSELTAPNIINSVKPEPRNDIDLKNKAKINGNP